MELKIGELAKRSGVSVRTLHHYHEIGLLTPSLHSSGEHRRYGAADVLKLQQIRSLQALGLSLAEVREALARPDHSPLATVERHLAIVEDELAAGRRLQTRLAWLAERLRTAVEPTLDELTQTLEALDMYEQHYTTEQLDSLRQRANTIGAERIQQVQEEWSVLFRELADAARAGETAAAPRVRELAVRAKALIREFTGGDRGISKSLSNVYRAEGGENVMARHGMPLEPGVWELLQAAMAALPSDA